MKCPSQTRVKLQKGQVNEQRTANVQMSQTVEVVWACQPQFTQTTATITRFGEYFHCPTYLRT